MEKTFCLFCPYYNWCVSKQGIFKEGELLLEDCPFRNEEKFITLVVTLSLN